MKKLIPFVLVAAALTVTAFKVDDPDLRVITRIKQEGFNNSKVMNTLFEMTDVNGPRLTGSAGMKSAEEWAKNKFTEWGLENVHIESWGGFGKGWEIQKCYVAMTAPYYQSLIAVPKAWTPGTNGMISSEAVLVKTDSLSKYKGKLRGKIVVLATGEAYDYVLGFKADATRLTDEDLQKLTVDPHVSDADNARNRGGGGRPFVSRQKVDSFLMAEGVAAVVGMRRGNMGTVFTSNGASRAWDAKPVLPELEMGTEHIYRLERLLDAGKKVNLEMDIKTSFSMADSTEYNVVAEIPGTDKNLKDELVIIGAHMDSWHAATGTTDNATGSAVMMEAMRILKTMKIKPRRTIRIVLWSGEEQGLLGSRGYVKKHFADRKTMKLKPDHELVSAYYNLDNGAGKIRGIYMQSNDAVRPIFEAWLAPFKDLGATTVTLRNTGSTDHISFDEVGIPGFQFIQDPLEYGSRTHHTNMDTYDRVNPNDMMQASVIIASFVYNTAMRDEMIPRKPMPKKQN
ncbi:MAG: M20/M25/M40 family metallo-hydrolase [Bacteroidetes bacterium]|nr:M20/M25/M40 family metallo-hydrolase [Bacteroidota bacterium]